MCGNVGIPTAAVVLKGPDGIPRKAAAIGTGPVDAAFRVSGWVSGEGLRRQRLHGWVAEWMVG